MADYIVLESSTKNNQIRVVVHTDVPNTNNAAGQNWRTVLTEYLESTTSRVPVARLPVGRQADLDTGVKYEWEMTHEDDANDTPANRIASLEAAIQAEESSELTRLQNTLNYWGQTGTVT